MQEQFNAGCLRDPLDERDLIYEKSLGANIPLTDEEWAKGFDIEKELNIKIPLKDQKNSYSCVGQGTAYYTAVLNAKETGKYDEVSAKAIYSQISLGFNRGAYIRDGVKLIVEFGALMEEAVRSYKENGGTDEEFMRDKSWITPEITKIAKILQSKEYRMITGMGIDIVARAIKDNYGVVGGVDGVNNGTWHTPEPKPPVSVNDATWGHCLYFGKFGIDKKGKWISTPNSWGKMFDPDDLHEDGWQKIREDYFANNNRWIYNPWTLLDRPNNNNDMTFKKEIGKSSIYLIDEAKKTKTMIVDMPTLTVLSGNFEEVASLSAYKDNGSLVWTERIIN